jgi:hypothetical protein
LKALLLVRLEHVANSIVNADHDRMLPRHLPSGIYVASVTR